MGVFSHPSSLAGSASLPSSPSPSPSPSPSSSSLSFSPLHSPLGGRIVGFKERMAIKNEKRERPEKESGLLTVCGGVGVEIEAEIKVLDNSTDETPESKKICVYPVDYIGDELRPFDCSFSLITPAPSCEPSPYGVGYDGSPVCFRYSLKDQVTLSYQMNCYFQDPPEDPDFNPFDYDAYITKAMYDDGSDGSETESTPINESTVTFALSKGRKSEFFSFLKVFNFNRFSDLSASQVLALSLDQIRGIETINFTLDFSKISQEKFIFGKRMYVEMGLQTLANGAKMNIRGLSKNIKDRRHFDFPETKLREAPLDYLSVGWKRFLLLYIGLGVIGVLLIVYWGSKYVLFMSKVFKADKEACTKK